MRGRGFPLLIGQRSVKDKRENSSREDEEERTPPTPRASVPQQFPETNDKNEKNRFICGNTCLGVFCPQNVNRGKDEAEKRDAERGRSGIEGNKERHVLSLFVLFLPKSFWPLVRKLPSNSGYLVPELGLSASLSLSLLMQKCLAKYRLSLSSWGGRLSYFALRSNNGQNDSFQK